MRQLRKIGFEPHCLHFLCLLHMNYEHPHPPLVRFFSRKTKTSLILGGLTLQTFSSSSVHSPSLLCRACTWQCMAVGIWRSFYDLAWNMRFMALLRLGTDGWMSKECIRIEAAVIFAAISQCPTMTNKEQGVIWKVSLTLEVGYLLQNPHLSFWGMGTYETISHLPWPSAKPRTIFKSLLLWLQIGHNWLLVPQFSLSAFIVPRIFNL